MAQLKDKPTAPVTPAAAASGSTAAPAPVTQQNATPAKTRTRLSMSKDKKLAYLLAGLVSILSSKQVATVLTEDQKTKVATAKKMADEIGGGDVLKPVTDRIQAIQVELKAIDYSKDPEKASAQVKELALELDKQIKRKKQIEEMIGA